MAGLPSNTLATYQAIGNREDLSDDIFRISPTDTPFFTGVEKTKATAVTHEWQTQDLASVDTSNYVLEGDDATTDAVTARVRLSNYCNISDKVARVTGTQQAVETAGVPDELANQEMLKGLELRRDMESILLANQAKVVGDTTTARRTAGIMAWIKTNESTSGTAPATAGTNSRTNGTQRAFTEQQLKTVISAIWTQGGKPETIMVGAFNKQVFSTFVGRSTPMEEAKSKKIVASVDAYESDFGTLKVVANRFSSSRSAFVLEMDKWKVAFLNGRKMVSIPLAVTGDSRQRQVLSEYCLESCNEKASGGVFDLTTA